MKQELLELLSDGIMSGDWEYVKKAYKVIKEYNPGKEKIRVSAAKEEVLKEDYNEEVVQEIKKEAAVKKNAYGNVIEFYDDGTSKSDIEIDKKLWAGRVPSERRPEEVKRSYSCAGCGDSFMMTARERDTRTTLDESEKIGVLCNSCLKSRGKRG